MITNNIANITSGFTAPIICRFSPVDKQTLITKLAAANAARQVDVSANPGNAITSGDTAKPFSGFCAVDQPVLDNVGTSFDTLPELTGETLELGDVVVWPSINADNDGSADLTPTDEWIRQNLSGAVDWFRGDFNGDGVIDAADQAIFDAAVLAP